MTGRTAWADFFHPDKIPHSLGRKPAEILNGWPVTFPPWQNTKEKVEIFNNTPFTIALGNLRHAFSIPNTYPLNNIHHPDKIPTSIVESRPPYPLLLGESRAPSCFRFWAQGRHLVFEFGPIDAILFFCLGQGLLPPGPIAPHWTPLF